MRNHQSLLLIEDLSCQFKSDHYLSQTKQLEGVSLIQLLFS